MGQIIMGIFILVLVTIITMYMEWSIGQIAENKEQWKITSLLAGAIGMLVLDLSIFVSPLGEAVWLYFDSHSSRFGTISTTFEYLVFILAVDLLFAFFCYGAGKDSFNDRPRPRH